MRVIERSAVSVSVLLKVIVCVSVRDFFFLPTVSVLPGVTLRVTVLETVSVWDVVLETVRVSERVRLVESVRVFFLTFFVSVLPLDAVFDIDTVMVFV